MPSLDTSNYEHESLRLYDLHLQTIVQKSENCTLTKIAHGKANRRLSLLIGYNNYYILLEIPYN